MNKDTKILLMAVVIILVALVSFNLSDLTGKIVKGDVSTLTVSPTVVTFGKHDVAKMVTIRVSPGKNGIDKKIVMYRKDGNTQVGSQKANICNDNICKEDVTISYRLNAELKSGRYYFKAKRENSGAVFMSNVFEIRHE